LNAWLGLSQIDLGERCAVAFEALYRASRPGVQKALKRYRLKMGWFVVFTKAYAYCQRDIKQ
jgi:hypothetical protein